MRGKRRDVFPYPVRGDTGWQLRVQRDDVTLAFLGSGLGLGGSLTSARMPRTTKTTRSATVPAGVRCHIHLTPATAPPMRTRIANSVVQPPPELRDERLRPPPETLIGPMRTEARPREETPNGPSLNQTLMAGILTHCSRR